MTSFGNGAAASSSSGISAWSGVRSAIAARAPCSSAGGSGSGSRIALPTSGRKNSRYSRGPAARTTRSCARNSSTAGWPRATPKHGGSPTVSDASTGFRAAASSETTAPYECADEMVALAQLGRDLVRLLLEVDPLERRPGRIAAAREEHALEPILERALRRPRRGGVPDAAVDEDESRHKPHVIVARRAKFNCYKVCCPRSMEPTSRPNFQLAGAGGVLFGVTAACIVLGALIGWAAGSLAYGLVFGAVIGIPAGVAATILRYRDM